MNFDIKNACTTSLTASRTIDMKSPDKQNAELCKTAGRKLVVLLL